MTQEESQAKRPRIAQCTELESALPNWVLQMEHNELCLSQLIIQEKTRKLAMQFGISTQ